MKRSLLSLALLVSASSAFAIDDTSITVKVDGVETAVGQVCVSLHKGQLNRPGDRDANTITKCVPAAVGSVSIDFTGVGSGQYAVSAFLDKDGNGELGHIFSGPNGERFAYFGKTDATPWKTKFNEVAHNFAGASNVVTLNF